MDNSGPALGSRTAKEQNCSGIVELCVYVHLDDSLGLDDF